MHCKKVGYLIKNWGNSLNFYLCPNQVRYCMELIKNVFTLCARTPIRVTSEYLGWFFLLPEGMLGDTSLLPMNMNSGNIDTASLKCEYSCIICPNVQNFCLNNGQFSSVGNATAYPASPWRTLMAFSNLCWHHTKTQWSQIEYVIRPPGPWTTSRSLSRRCSQLD